VRALLGYPKASVWKFSNSDEAGGGVLLNVFDTGNDTWAVAVDSDDNVIVGGERVLTGGGYNQGAWKLDKGICWIAFVLNVWYLCRGVAVDDDGNIYAAHFYGVTGRTTKHDRFGFKIWEYAALGIKLGIAVDASHNVYTAGYGGFLNSAIKNYPTGEVAWDADAGPSAQGVVVDGDGNSYYAGDRDVPDTKNVWKFNSIGVEQWSYDTLGSSTHGIAFDADGNVWVVGERVNSKSVWKLNGTTGALLDSFDTGGDAWGIAIEDAQWVSLDKHKASPWKNEAEAYDEGDVPTPETYAFRDKKAGELTEWLELVLRIPRRCDKVKVWARTEVETDDNLEVELYYDGSWHGCIDTSGFQSTWKEESFTAALIERVRVRLKGGDDGETVVWHRVYEVMLHRTLNFYVVGDRVDSKSVWKFDDEGDVVWTIDTGDDTKGIAIDSAGNVLVAGIRVWPPPP